LSRNATYVLVPALLIGFLGNLLFQHAPPFGVNLTAWILTLFLVTNYCIYKRQFAWNNPNRVFCLVACIFALCLSWRDSTVLLALAWFGLMVSVLLASVPVEKTKRRMTEWGLLFSLPLYGLTIVLTRSRCPKISGDIQSLSSPNPLVRSMLVGTILALPILILFSSLMASADQVFETAIANFFDFTSIIGHAFRWFVSSLFAASLIILWGKKRVDQEQIGIPHRDVLLGTVELSTVLVLCNLLFVLFVTLQISYLFGGHDWIRNTTGQTYAEYARRGFFELCALVALVIPLLLFFDWILMKHSPESKKIFRLLSAGLVGQLFVIIFSALHRMLLYMDQYGLTQLRVYVALFLFWLFGALVWFLVTVSKGQQPRFIQGTVYYALAGIFALFLINPDYQIMRYNVHRAIDQGEFDSEYAGRLSLDAAPAITQIRDLEISATVKNQLLDTQYDFKHRAENFPLLAATWSRYRAQSVWTE